VASTNIGAAASNARSVESPRVRLALRVGLKFWSL